MDFEKTVEELRTELANSEQRIEGTILALRDEQRAFFVSSSPNIPTRFLLSSRDQKIGDNHPTAPYSAFQLSAGTWCVLCRPWFKPFESVSGRQVEEITRLETTIQLLRIQLSDSQQNAKTELASSQLVVRVHRQKHECETLYADGHVIDAAKSLLDVTKSVTDDVKSDAIIMDWLSGGFSSS